MVRYLKKQKVWKTVCSNIRDENFKEIALNMRLEEFKVGDIIGKIDDRIDKFYIIMQGQVLTHLKNDQIE